MVPELAKDVSHPSQLTTSKMRWAVVRDETLLRGSVACGIGAGLTVEVRKFLLERGGKTDL